MKPYAAELNGDSALSAMVLHPCGPNPLNPFEPFRIETIAEFEDTSLSGTRTTHPYSMGIRSVYLTRLPQKLCGAIRTGDC